MFGLKTIQEPLANERRVCPNCLGITDHTVIKHAQQVTLYFIPVFTIRPQVVYTCQKCGASHTITYSDYLETQPQASQPQPKAKVTLNGKLVGDEINTSLPFLARLNSDAFLKWAYIALAGLTLVAVVVVVILLPGLIH
jgi:hypothetical protein